MLELLRPGDQRVNHSHFQTIHEPSCYWNVKVLCEHWCHSKNCFRDPHQNLRHPASQEAFSEHRRVKRLRHVTVGAFFQRLTPA